MTKKRFSPEQIIMKLREAEVLLSQDQTVKQVCRSLEISEQPYYLCWLLNSSIQSFGTYANMLTSSEWDTQLPDLLLPRHWAEYT